MATATITSELITRARGEGWREVMNSPRNNSVVFRTCPENCGRNVSIEFRNVKDTRKSNILICAACHAQVKIKKTK